MLQGLFGNTVISCTGIFECYKRILIEREDAENDEIPDRSVTARTEGTIKKLV